MLWQLQQRSVTEVPIPGGWKHETVTLAGRDFRLLLPADPDAFLETLELLAQDGGAVLDPYWARLWPCALTMAESILKQEWTNRGPALELGCGVGLPGLAALAQGLEVTFSDHELIAVAVAVENARRNSFTDARGWLLDWCAPRAERFPLILASDVIYDVQWHAPLLDLLRQMLTDDGACWIADPGRYHATTFVQRAVDSGFHVTAYDESDREIQAPHSGRYQRIVVRKTAH